MSYKPMKNTGTFDFEAFCYFQPYQMSGAIFISDDLVIQFQGQLIEDIHEATLTAQGKNPKDGH